MSPQSPNPELRDRESDDLAALAGVKLGNYRLERLVGRGRMGAVYLAQDEALLRPTAIKILAWRVAEAQGQDPVQWFLAEARLVARINHPRVVQIYGAAKHGDHCYIAMEYVPGHSAEAIVARGKPMPPTVATDVMLQAASALHAAHRSGVIHRDVKPANLLMGDNGVTKLGDFGMALGLADSPTGTAHVRVGTPYYTAPEIWRGEAAQAASDIYSLGATYFQLLTGRPPYPGHDVAAIEQAHLRAPIPDPREVVPGLPASCAALVKRALAKAPRERHATAQELFWDGRRVLQDLTSAAAGARTERSARPRAPSGAAATPSRPLAGPLVDVLGLVRRPFAAVDPAACPYQGEPFASVRDRVVERLEDDATPAVALVGAAGTGRGTLARRIAAELGRTRVALVADGGKGAGGQTFLQQLSRAAGASEDATEDGSLDALVLRLGELRQEQGAAPIVVLDGVEPTDAATAGLRRIVEAGVWSRSFKLLLVGAEGLVAALGKCGLDLHGEQLPEIALPPLGRDQLAAYLEAWLAVARPPQGPPIIVSRDATLLLALRSGGVLAQVNCIAENMLLLAAAARRRTITSFEAWIASDQERWAASRPASALPRRPELWPPPEVADVIDACRRTVGMPPWPRDAAANRGGDR
jgi:type II secretory pathway predicted ATPase ExeA